MKKWLKRLFFVSLLIQNMYYGADNHIYCDYVLDGEWYTGVFIGDMMDNLDGEISGDLFRKGMIYYTDGRDKQ